VILVVTHDPVVLRAATEALASIESSVSACADPLEALEYVAAHEPELIVTDATLPTLSGTVFREQYTQRFPERHTLFTFLVQPEQMQQLAQEIDVWGDDFVVKPLDAATLRARVRLTIRRSRVGFRARFRGDIKALPIMRVIQFCEKGALTGRVRFETNEGRVQIGFRAGEMVDDDGEATEKLTELLRLEEGTFVIESNPVLFEEIEDARTTSLPPPKPARQIPIARTSALRFGKRELSLRTEYEPAPINKVVSVVSLDAQVIRRHDSEVPRESTGQEAWQIVNERHEKMEEEVRGTVDQFFGTEALIGTEGNVRLLPPDELARPKTATSPAAKGRKGFGARALEDKDALFDQAIRKWREDDLEGALSLMEGAEALDPDDRSLQVCLRVLRRRLQPT